MPDESIELLKQKLVTPVQVIGIGRIVLLGLSLILLAFGVLVYAVRWRRHRQAKGSVPAASIPIATLAPASTADTIISKI
jgi:predicted cation transporter